METIKLRHAVIKYQPVRKINPVVRPLKRLLGCNIETGMGKEDQVCESMVMNVMVVVVMTMMMMMMVVMI